MRVLRWCLGQSLVWGVFLFCGCGGGGGGGSSEPDQEELQSEPTLVTFSCHKEAANVVLSWEVPLPGDEILVYEGTDLLATLNGESTGFSREISQYGIFRYTVILVKDGKQVSRQSCVLDFGRIVWDPPPTLPEGYRFYFAKTPKGEPCNFPCTGCSYLELPVQRQDLPLKEVYGAGLIEPGKNYCVAARSFSGALESEFSNAVSFTFFVRTAEP